MKADEERAEEGDRKAADLRIYKFLRANGLTVTAGQAKKIADCVREADGQ